MESDFLHDIKYKELSEKTTLCTSISPVSMLHQEFRCWRLIVQYFRRNFDRLARYRCNILQRHWRKLVLRHVFVNCPLLFSLKIFYCGKDNLLALFVEFKC